MVAVPAVGPALYRLRNSLNPGRTVPSAKENDSPAAVAPGTSVPPSTTDPNSGSYEKYMGRSATIGTVASTCAATLAGDVMPSDPKYRLTLTVTREWAGSAWLCGATVIGIPPSSVE